jgi:hypothetical protein
MTEHPICTGSGDGGDEPLGRLGLVGAENDTSGLEHEELGEFDSEVGLSGFGEEVEEGKGGDAFDAAV